jgi:hypothetical protein
MIFCIHRGQLMNLSVMIACSPRLACDLIAGRQVWHHEVGPLCTNDANENELERSSASLSPSIKKLYSETCS